MTLFQRVAALPSAEHALPGRTVPAFDVAQAHAVLGHSLRGPYPQGLEVAVFGLGCFWGAEQLFWRTPGVWTTAVGYSGGLTPNPTYEEVCSGLTGHAEVVLVVFDPAKVSYDRLLKLFWEDHDPTQGMQQGNDIGTQYRSVIYTTGPAQEEAAAVSRETFQRALTAAGMGEATTEITALREFYFAEEYHQQYLHKVPNGYCPVHATGVVCATGA